LGHTYFGYPIWYTVKVKREEGIKEKGEGEKKRKKN
jgi:hypothetical protein